jgi:hypothetical protein
VKLVVRVAVPDVSVSVPREFVPLRNFTVPVAVEGDTVAVSVTLAPTVVVETDGDKVTEEEVVPVTVPGACQKSPQPDIKHAANASRAKVFPFPIAEHFMPRPLFTARRLSMQEF